ncbi:uncharacterized protein LOC131018522 [Salvia miltiorrhiza]|uniref:uncharacterized protein LOC131018522 n=1 Tax=Salvia miltiorrhiza TaxID=226208 RepID=UPI0025AD5C39|nr:uncharacterized protein LOC131018522 [Salvia miltiorrhiza]
MEKGYFTVKFMTMEDKLRVKNNSIQELPTGHIRLREWVRYFDPYKESSSLAQIWVRIYYLPWEFWKPEVISGIGRALGTPIRIDHASANAEVGHFARILVEVDMARPILNSMYIDDGNTSFYIEFGFETMPFFCSHCKITGHSSEKCRRLPADKAKVGTKQAEPMTVEVAGLKPSWQAKAAAVSLPKDMGALGAGLEAVENSSQSKEIKSAGKEKAPVVQQEKQPGVEGNAKVLNSPRMSRESPLRNSTLTNRFDALRYEPECEEGHDQPLNECHSEDEEMDEELEMEPAPGKEKEALVLEKEQVSSDIASRLSRLEEQVSQGM